MTTDKKPTSFKRGGTLEVGSQINEKYSRFVLKVQGFLYIYHGVIFTLLCALAVGFCVWEVAAL